MRWMALLLVCAGLALAYAIRELAQGGPADGPRHAAAAPARSEARPKAPRAETAAPASNLYYQYVDGANQVQFARNLEEVPEEWRGRAGRVSLPVPPPASPARKAQREPKPSAARMHAEGMFSAARSEERGGGAQPEIEIYTMKSCGYCRAAMAYMDKRGIGYTNRDIEDEPEAREEYLEKTGGRAGVPVIDIEGEILQGWSQQHFDTVLASRRQ